MMQGMELQIADMEKSTNERLNQGRQYIEETQEAWQEAIMRASEAEKRTRELEKTVTLLQEQLHVNQIHQQLWAPHQSEPPAAQIVKSPSGDTTMGNSSHDTSMEEPASDERNTNGNSNDVDVDTDMSEVNRMFRLQYVYKLI